MAAWTPSDNDRYNFLKNSICIVCQQSNIDFIIPECFHPCHSTCFTKNWCQSCARYRGIQSDSLKCNLCKSSFNLIKCSHCQKTLCFPCIILNPLEGCCAALKSQAQTYSSICPGCEYTFYYSSMSHLSCRNHESLCNNCWNIGNLAKKCVMGCAIDKQYALIVRCSVCNLDGIKYCGIMSCGSCYVCYDCQSKKNLNTRTQYQMTCAKCQAILMKIGA